MKKNLRKKGFTMVELVVVIAIIAVLIAMILPSLSTSGANKSAAVSASKDFYSATQYLFTKYSKFESWLYTGQKSEENVGGLIKYDKSLGGNYQNYKYLGIAMCVRNSKIAYVNIVGSDNAQDCESALFGQNGVSDITGFEQMFSDDVDSLFEKQDGMYYAYVNFESNAGLGTENTNNVKVLAAAYCVSELPAATDYTAFEQTYLYLTDMGLNADGEYFGVCSSLRDTTIDRIVGSAGSYFRVAF